MSIARWIDHIPPWLAFGAVASTGVYEPMELVFMTLPLLFAALAEGRRWELGTWRRYMEALAVLALLGLLGARIGLIPTVIQVLFLLCGIRLALPRELPQKRQLLLMGFLIWITTALSTFELDFLIWSALWVCGTAMVLLQQAWEASANLRRGMIQPAPHLRILGWSLSTFLLAAFFFVSLPRVTLGLRTFPWGVAGLTAPRAGLSDTLDLGNREALAPNGDVVLRIIPPEGLAPEAWEHYAQSLELLKGITLETMNGLKWQALANTPPPSTFNAEPSQFQTSRSDGRRMFLECFVAPGPMGLLSLPYGRIGLIPPPSMPIRLGVGGSLRWRFPSRRPVPLRLLVEPGQPFAERAPKGRRLALLTTSAPGMESVNRWSRRTVPGNPPSRNLAEQLTAALGTFRYTLDNPSGKAANPLEDFLENTHAGHCEYFASALAVMLRYRGVPARVVNGYRLGPWIPEGGYWLVTQNEAHSWVEYFDNEGQAWRVADPTPPAPPAALDAATLMAAFQRWTDAIRFRWDRNVVRFSDEDQQAGLEWLTERSASLPDWTFNRRWVFVALAAGIAIVLSRLRKRLWASRQEFRITANRKLKALKPLLRKTRTLAQPHPGETARSWILRLSLLHPERRRELGLLADEVDAVIYGTKSAENLPRMAREEARAWNRVPR